MTTRKEMQNSKIRSKLRKEWINNGLCGECRKRRENQSISLCNQYHKAKRRAAKLFVSRRKETQRCLRCNEKAVEKNLCPKCSKKVKLQKRERKENLEKEGVCNNCGKNKEDAEFKTCKKCREKRRARHINSKKKVMQAYGGKCNCCGDSFIGRLTIDHLNNNGNEHRRQIGSNGGSSFYFYLIRNNYPSGYQVLCSSCNLCKHTMGHCPH